MDEILSCNRSVLRLFKKLWHATKKRILSSSIFRFWLASMTKLCSDRRSYTLSCADLEVSYSCMKCAYWIPEATTPLMYVRNVHHDNGSSVSAVHSFPKLSWREVTHRGNFCVWTISQKILIKILFVSHLFVLQHFHIMFTFIINSSFFYVIIIEEREKEKEKKAK